MNFLIILFPSLFLIFFGIFDGAQTARKDLYDKSTLYDYYKNKNGNDKFGHSYLEWYKGGNNIFTKPGNPLKCDFWHFCKNMWTYCISGFALSLILSFLLLQYPYKFFLLFYIFSYGIEGLTFMFFYGWVFRKEKEYKNILSFMYNKYILRK